MALSIVKELLEQYLKSLFDEGIVNDQFHHIQNLKTVEEPDHVVQLINTYCLDVEAILSELASNTDLPEVNFSHLETLAHQVEEKSMYIGAEHVRLACAGLIQACRQMHKRNFCCALSWTECEFTRTRNKFQACVQMEWKIMRLESKKRQK
ncbi:hypothetical protein P3X46_000067 [Hevea brasiliensis]|uniref:Histidine-containing phosphotransfer protein n=1 Tax=Hevea brasiliensis TaxID=3981 RepID=A0ABQ9NAJ1_HEVBR|nr:hypothetical protein P3X46_000067 [Hevea brasiliensis]